MADNAVTQVLNKGPRVKANSRFSNFLIKQNYITYV